MIDNVPSGDHVPPGDHVPSGDRLRVMHVIEAMHQGGAESLIVEHARHAAPDVEPMVCALNRDGPALDLAERAGAKVFRLGKGKGRASGMRRLVQILKEHKIDVVNGHNPTGGLYAALAGAMARVPAVIRTEHSVHYPGRHSRAYALGLESLATFLTRRVVCVCEASRASHARRLRWAASRFVTVLNGISSGTPVRSRAEMRAELGVDPNAPVALAVGSLTRQKSHERLLEAFAVLRSRLPAARLLIAGEGPLRRDLEDLIQRRGQSGSAKLLGSRLDVSDLLEASDVFVLSSEREGLSVTLLEAMRGARAAVVTRVGGNSEAVVDGETGLVVPANDTPAMAEALKALLADPARAARLGAAARDRWARDFTAERMVAATEAIYRQALGTRRHARVTPAAEERQHASA